MRNEEARIKRRSAGEESAGEESEGDGSHDFWRKEYENGNGTRTYPFLRVHENGHLYLTEETHTAKSTLSPDPDHGGIMTIMIQQTLVQLFESKE